MPITKLGFKRLYRLCDYMESLPKTAAKHFDMSTYISHRGGDHEHEVPEKPSVKDLHTCGTSACALGWAMTVPSFRRAGLIMEDYEVMQSHQVFGLPDWTDFDDPDYWEDLFGGDNRDKTPKAWAKRARKLLKKWERDGAKA